jgi:hypothetical protein
MQPNVTVVGLFSCRLRRSRSGSPHNQANSKFLDLRITATGKFPIALSNSFLLNFRAI